MIEKLCVQFLLPLQYNDKTDIEPTKFKQVKDNLLKQFGGFSIFPFSIEGGWVNPENEITYFDRCKLFEVTISNTQENIELLERFKEELKVLFRQHEIYMKCITIHQI